MEAGLGPHPVKFALTAFLEEQVTGFHILWKNIALFQSRQSLKRPHCKLSHHFFRHALPLFPMNPQQRLQTEMLDRRAQIHGIISEVIGFRFEVVYGTGADFSQDGLLLHHELVDICVVGEGDDFDDQFFLGLGVELGEVEVGGGEADELEGLFDVDFTVDVFLGSVHI